MKALRQENLIYLAVWGLLFAAPLLSLYVRTTSDPGLMFSWTEVFIVWHHFVVYLLLFLAHNFLLAPLLVHGRKRIAYFTAVTAIIAAFTLYQCSGRPDMRNHRPPMERPGHRRPPFDEPPPMVGERDIMAVAVLILMFGANLGIKGYFRSREDRRRLAMLERENLEQQLEYLRYQISPHFFMNTLNNIHALVDIDPEKAKDTILELSKMMRYVLYEGNKQEVPLSREFDFIRHYVALMQLRYTDKVKISLDLPQEVPDCHLPPLILVTFIENAFKHGVSYQRESFISIKATVLAPPAQPATGAETHRLLFSCCNSKAEKPNQEKGGVGLQNVRQRLTLLYDNNYSLHIDDTPDVYAVELTLPLL